MSGAEVEALTLWLFKVGLLLKHPASRHDEPEQNARASRWTGMPQHLLSWMSTGDAPPPGLSLFMSRRSPSDTDEEPRRVPLPTVVIGVATDTYRSVSFGMHGVDFYLVYHPGWPLSLSLLAEKRIVQLWPNPPQRLDIEMLPMLSARVLRFVEGGRVIFDGDVFPPDGLPALGDRLNLHDLVSAGHARAVSR